MEVWVVFWSDCLKRMREPLRYSVANSTLGWLGGLLLIPSLAGNLWGQDLDAEIRKCQDAVYRLEFGLAEGVATELIEQYPDRPGPYAALAVTRWNQLLQAAGNLALDDYATPNPFTEKPRKDVKSQQHAFREANGRLMALCDRLLGQNPKNVEALYFQGVAYENLASEAIAISRKWWDAQGLGRRATGRHREVLAIDPGFVDAKLSIGVEEFARATVPWGIKWLTILFFPGNKENALRAIREVADKGRFRRLDAQVVLALLEAWKGDPRESARIFENLRREYPSNYLLDLNLAAIYQRNLDSPKEALQIYLQLLDSMDHKAPGLMTGEVYYQVARTYHRLREYGKAREALDKALASPKRELETEALSAFLLASIEEEQGDAQSALSWYQRFLSSAPPGDVLKKEREVATKRVR